MPTGARADGERAARRSLVGKRHRLVAGGLQGLIEAAPAHVLRVARHHEHIVAEHRDAADLVPRFLIGRARPDGVGIVDAQGERGRERTVARLVDVVGDAAEKSDRSRNRRHGHEKTAEDAARERRKLDDGRHAEGYARA